MPKRRTYKPPETNITLIFIALAALIVGFYASKQLNIKTGPVNLQNSTLYPKDFRPMPEFQLTDHNKTAFTQQAFKNTWSIVFFGFTFCPDVCPTTMATIETIYSALKKEYPQEPIQTVFISVDPERDTVDKLNEYVTYFNPAFNGVTGEMDQIQKLTQYFGVYFAKAENPDNNQHYLIDHNASIFLISPKGRLHALMSPPHDAGKIIADFKDIHSHY